VQLIIISLKCVTVLPSQTIPNPNANGKNVSVITLRSGKQTMEAAQLKEPNSEGIGAGHKEKELDAASKAAIERSIPVPFQQRLIPSKKMVDATLEKEILETFRKVKVNIPLLDTIKEIPKYAKFSKDLCTIKRKVKGNERVSLSNNVSALIQSMPKKCKDPRTFSIPCIIRNCRFDDCMLDLGASINLMPTFIFNSLGLGPLKATSVVIQLANRSNTHPVGLVENVLVRVNELIFPADFYILEMEGDSASSKSPIILGRPFLKTARTKIDVHFGTMSMEFGDNVVKFNIFYAMQHPREEHSILRIDVIDDVIDELFDSMHYESLDVFDKSDVCCDCKNNTWFHNCVDFPDIFMYDELVSYRESCIHDVDDVSDYSIDTKDV